MSDEPREVEDVLLEAGFVAMPPAEWKARDAAARTYGVKPGERVRLFGVGRENRGEVLEAVGADKLRVRWDRTGEVDVRPRRLLLRELEPNVEPGEWRVAPTDDGGAMVRVGQQRDGGAIDQSGNVKLHYPDGATGGVIAHADFVAMWPKTDAPDVLRRKLDAFPSS